MSRGIAFIWMQVFKRRSPDDSKPTPLRRALPAAIFRLVVASIALASVFHLLAKRFGPAPAMGPFLDPVHGIWKRPPSPFEPGSKQSLFAAKGLEGRVEIFVDDDQVKHIFAENDHDLYFAQGWLLASERLWQMEFITRVASGRLSEVLGRRSLEFDKYFLKIGLADAAKASTELMMNDMVTSEPLKAYVAGVNAWIASIPPDQLPFEYKLLHHTPDQWTPMKAALLMKFMAFQLSGSSLDLLLTRSRSKLNEADFNELFPVQMPIPEPIIPKGMKWTEASPLPPAPKKPFVADLEKLEPIPQPNSSNGSNNWAVAGKKSTTGKPILSNDVHMDLSLPALFYELQLVSPTQNVYGATFPGSPGVILGFNQKLAWASTNGGDDVLDWYQLRFRDEKRTEFVYDGIWHPIVSRDFEIPVRDEAPVTITVRTTHFGPIVYDEMERPLTAQVPRGLAMRWTALEPSNELRSFILLNRAHTLKECHQAIDTFSAPAQNFLCADNSGDIGLWQMGRFPIRWRGQGRMLSDGSTSTYDWKGWIARDQVPFSVNPARGFLSSANQAPADETYPYPLGWKFEEPFRGERINEILRSKTKFSPDDFVTMQGDTLSIPARIGHPALVAALGPPEALSPIEKRALSTLANWDDRYGTDSVAATVFQTWLDQMLATMWSPYFPNSQYYLYPTLETSLHYIADVPTARWFDDPNTPQVETIHDRALASFKAAVASLKMRFGSDVEDWRWSRVHPTEFPHVAKIRGLGRQGFSAPGEAYSIFANKGNHGPAWKLVVALGSQPRAWSVYPGGQSGDPTSAYYDNFVPAWGEDRLREVIFLANSQSVDSHLLKKIELRNLPHANGQTNGQTNEQTNDGANE